MRDGFFNLTVVLALLYDRIGLRVFTHNGKGTEDVHVVVSLPVLDGRLGKACDGSKYSMVDNNAIKLSVRKESELYSSVCSL